MTAVIETLISISIFTAVIFCGIMIFKKLAKNKISPVLQCALWLVLVARLAFPFTLESGFHFYTVDAPAAAEQSASADIIPEQNGTNRSSNTYKAQTVAPVVTDNKGGTMSPDPNMKAMVPGQTGGTAGEPSWTPELSTEQTIVLVWLIGIALVALVLTACRIGMAHRIKKGAMLPDGRIGKIFQECKKELKIKGKISMRLCASLATPAITVSFRPELLLPLDLYQEEESILRYAILHELTHYKRADHLLRIVMNVLKAVWWFNPIVWLADRQIVMDMETACDSMVVARMEKEEKKRYANTVLGMFSSGQAGRYVLGMALGSSKAVAEKRIRGMYMNGKTKRGVRLAALILVGVMGIACFTTACAPAEAANTDMAQPTLEQVSGTPTEAPQIDAQPEHITKTLPTENENVTIEIDADVIRPDKESIPQRGYEIRQFTQQDVDNAIKALMGGKELYAPIRTKADIQKDIDNMDPAGKRTIAEWEEELKTAPETAEKKPANTKLTRISRVGEDIGDGILQHSFTMEQDEMSVWADAGDSHDALEVRTNSNMGASASWLTFNSGLKGYDAQGSQKQLWHNEIAYEGDARGQKTTREEAQALAAKAVQTLDPAMTLDFTELIPVVDIPETAYMTPEDYEKDPQAAQEKSDAAYNKTNEEASTAPQVYRFYFTRDVDGVKEGYTSATTYFYDSKTPNIVGDYNGILSYEQMSVIVDDNGITQLSWGVPAAIGAPTGDGALISLDDAIDIMQANLFSADPWFGNAYSGDIMPAIAGSAKISGIRLNYARVMNEDESLKLVPVWDFFGTYDISIDGRSMGQDSGFVDLNPAHSLFTLNALDGTIVFREQTPMEWQGQVEPLLSDEDIARDSVGAVGIGEKDVECSASVTPGKNGEKATFTFIVKNKSDKEITNCQVGILGFEDEPRLMGEEFSLKSGESKRLTYREEADLSTTALEAIFAWKQNGEMQNCGIGLTAAQVQPAPQPLAGEPIPTPTPAPSAAESQKSWKGNGPQPTPTPTPTPQPSAAF